MKQAIVAQLDKALDSKGLGIDIEVLKADDVKENLLNIKTVNKKKTPKK